MIRYSLLVFITLIVSTFTYAQETIGIKKDLRDQWLIFNNEAYTTLDKQQREDLKSIHFTINANHYPNDQLLLSSAKTFFVFLNGKLIKDHKGELYLSLDSLEDATRSAVLNFTIYQNSVNRKDLKTLIVTPLLKQTENVAKPDTYFRDFVILSGLVLIIFFVIMIRTHPKLASDYFSVTRILSIREAEDNQPQARLAISSNVLFYIFSSLLFGLCLFILMHHLPDDHLLPLAFKAASFGGVLLQWLKLSTIIFILLMAKITLVFSLSNLFGLKGIAGIHFFNWIRLLLIVSAALSVAVFIYFISRGSNTTIYLAVLSIIVLTLVGWVVIVFLKLNNRTEHSMFHLFSYICATEVIPLLITIKVLFQ